MLGVGLDVAVDDGRQLGIPTEEEYLAAYIRHSQRQGSVAALVTSHSWCPVAWAGRSLID